MTYAANEIIKKRFMAGNANMQRIDKWNDGLCGASAGDWTSCLLMTVSMRLILQFGERMLALR